VCELGYAKNIPDDVCVLIRTFLFKKANQPLYQKVMGYCENRLFFSEITKRSLKLISRRFIQQGLYWYVCFEKQPTYYRLEANNCPKCGEYLYHKSPDAKRDLTCHCRSWEDDEDYEDQEADEDEADEDEADEADQDQEDDEY
jgi:hypothetical protein